MILPMNDQQKRTRLREILADPKGAIAPGSDRCICSLAWPKTAAMPRLHLSGNAIHKNFCLPDRNLLTMTQIAQRVGADLPRRPTSR